MAREPLPGSGGRSQSPPPPTLAVAKPPTSALGP